MFYNNDGSYIIYTVNTNLQNTRYAPSSLRHNVQKFRRQKIILAVRTRKHYIPKEFSEPVNEYWHVKFSGKAL